MKATCVLAASSVIAAAVFAASEQTGNGPGLPAFPGAESRPEVARAVELYYGPGIGKTQTLSAGVFETPASFEEVCEFYAPRMDRGKWGFRKKIRTLIQHTETLKFMRAQLLAGQVHGGNRLPEILKPLFGDPELSPDGFSSKLDRLRTDNPEASILVAEGSRTVSVEEASCHVRVTIERPYIDLETMRLVDKTRLVMVKVSQSLPR